MKEGVFIFKKIIMFILMATVSVPKNITNPSTHPEFKEIIFPYSEASELVEDMEEVRINNAYKKIKRRVFGWSVKEIVTDEKVKYVSDTIFSKANNTSSALTFVYKCTLENETQTSISVTGDLGITGNAKGKVLSGGLEAKVRATVGWVESKSVTETTETKLIVSPKTKLSIIIKGEALVNNGVAKYYFLGIPFKKGTWEYVEILTEYYDYYEEKI